MSDVVAQILQRVTMIATQMGDPSEADPVFMLRTVGPALQDADGAFRPLDEEQAITLMLSRDAAAMVVDNLLQLLEENR